MSKDMEDGPIALIRMLACDVRADGEVSPVFKAVPLSSLEMMFGNPDFTQRPIPDAQRLYRELLSGVEWKWPNETAHETALRYIRQAERSRKAGGHWISVEEGMPPADDDKAILAFNGRVQECWYVGSAYEPAFGGAADCDPSFQDSEYSRIPNVTHWMPMPDGPAA
jgi:hypothetical protein